MNIEDLISQYIDGELPAEAEAELHHRLSVSPEDRKLFREHIMLRGIASDRRVLHQPAAALRAQLFDRLEREEGKARAVPFVAPTSASAMPASMPPASVPAPAKLAPPVPLQRTHTSRRRRLLPILIPLILGVIISSAIWQFSLDEPTSGDRIAMVDGSARAERQPGPATEGDADPSGETSTGAGTLRDESSSFDGGMASATKEKDLGSTDRDFSVGQSVTSSSGRGGALGSRTAKRENTVSRELAIVDAPVSANSAEGAGAGTKRTDADFDSDSFVPREPLALSPEIPSGDGEQVRSTYMSEQAPASRFSTIVPMAVGQDTADNLARRKLDHDALRNQNEIAAALQSSPSVSTDNAGPASGRAEVDLGPKVTTQSRASSKQPISPKPSSISIRGGRATETAIQVPVSVDDKAVASEGVMAPSAPPPPPASRMTVSAPPMDSTAVKEKLRSVSGVMLDSPLDPSMARGPSLMAHAQQNLLLGLGSREIQPETAVKIGGEFGDRHQLYAMVAYTSYLQTRAIRTMTFDQSGRNGQTSSTVETSTSDKRTEFWGGAGYRYSIEIGSRWRAGGGVWGGLGGRHLRAGAELPVSYQITSRIRLECLPTLQYIRATGEARSTAIHETNLQKAVPDQVDETTSVESSEVRAGIGVGVTVIIR